MGLIYKMNAIKKMDLDNNNYVLGKGQVPEYEDKTSENYIPKSYRTQPKLGILLTQMLDKYLGIKFLQPIKWTNTLSIGILHFFFLYYALGYPWNTVMLKTAIWGE